MSPHARGPHASPSSRARAVRIANIVLPCGHKLANARREITPMEVGSICGICGGRESFPRCVGAYQSGDRCIAAALGGGIYCGRHAR